MVGATIIRYLKTILHFVKFPARLGPSTYLLIVQLAGAFSVLYGVSYWSVPVALVLGGVGAILAVERQSTSPPAETVAGLTPQQVGEVIAAINLVRQKQAAQRANDGG